MDPNMMLLFAVRLLVPLSTGVLLVVILRKAGFGWGIAVLGLLPLLGQVLETGLLGGGFLPPTEVTLILAMLILAPLALLPYLLLAVRVWPRLAGLTTRSETFQ